jgi:gamma-glutamyltranspeptidase/glutathione hydrolase
MKNITALLLSISLLAACGGETSNSPDTSDTPAPELGQSEATGAFGVLPANNDSAEADTETSATLGDDLPLPEETAASSVADPTEDRGPAETETDTNTGTDTEDAEAAPVSSDQAAAPKAETPAPAKTADATAAAIVKNIGAGDRMPSGRTLGTRSSVVAPNAAAATAHPLATQVALDTMKAGGTAVDAAIAANAMLGLVEPTGNGIGGDLFAIVWDPATEKLYGYNGSGRSAMGATLADMQAAADEHMDGKEIPPFGAASVTVPGTVDGWFALHDKFGQRAMRDNLAPTIKYARAGAPIPEVIAFYWANGPKRYGPAFESGMLEEYDNAKATYFSPTPTEGSLFKNPDLANTLERIGKNGRDEFYTGETARTMSTYFARIGGFLGTEDFAEHEGEWVEPLCVDYRNTQLCELPPNTQGVAALQMLQMLEGFDLREMGYGSADSLMAQIGAKRLAFSDRAAGYADPAFSKMDPAEFIDEDYAKTRAKKIRLNKALIDPHETAIGLKMADAKLENGDTTYLTVADESGMMVSLIQSNYRGMGSGLVADNLGFMFQDRGQLFSLDPDHPNVFEPGKRPFHTIIPAFAFKDGKPWLSFGLMGGGMQPQGHVQIMLNLVDFDMGLQEAGDAARWEHRGGCEPTDKLKGDDCETDMGKVHLESGIPPEARAELEKRGHTVVCCNANAGGYQAIMRDFETGAWIAATEMRKDGSADGY